jgi:hypothetical protein
MTHRASTKEAIEPWRDAWRTGEGNRGPEARSNLWRLEVGKPLGRAARTLAANGIDQ